MTWLYDYQDPCRQHRMITSSRTKRPSDSTNGRQPCGNSFFQLQICSNQWNRLVVMSTCPAFITWGILGVFSGPSGLCLAGVLSSGGMNLNCIYIKASWWFTPSCPFKHPRELGSGNANLRAKRSSEKLRCCNSCIRVFVREYRLRLCISYCC